MTMLSFNELSTVIPGLLDLGTSIELRSAPGRGKSDWVRALIGTQAARTGTPWGMSTLFLATQTPSDLMGYMVPGVDNRERRISEYTMPPWMRTVDGQQVSDYARGVLFLDEYGQGESDVKRASAELLLNRRLGPWELPNGWSVIAASNRVGDRSGVTKGFDFVINRRLEIDIRDDIDSWEDWALAHGVDPLLVAFAKNNTQIVFADGVPDKQGPWCTPRSLVMAGNILDTLREVTPEGTKGPFPVSEMAQNLCGGMIGAAATAQLIATIKLEEHMPKLEDIIARPADMFVPTRPDVLMLMTYKLAMAAENDKLANIVTYLKRLPPEFVPMWIKAAVKYRPGVVNHPAMMPFYMANASLFASVVGAGNR